MPTIYTSAAELCDRPWAINFNAEWDRMQPPGCKYASCRDFKLDLSASRSHSSKAHEDSEPERSECDQR